MIQSMCPRLKGFSFGLISLLIIFCLSHAWAEALQKDKEKGKDQTIVTKSNQIEIDNQRKIVIFTGDVEAKTEDFVITCQKMLLYYHDVPSGNAPQKASMKIDKIVATGLVRITRSEGGIATAAEATYYQDEEKVVLTGSPVVQQGDDFVEGSRVTLFLKEERSVVEGSENTRVRAVISPKN